MDPQTANVSIISHLGIEWSCLYVSHPSHHHYILPILFLHYFSLRTSFIYSNGISWAPFMLWLGASYWERYNKVWDMVFGLQKLIFQETEIWDHKTILWGLIWCNSMRPWWRRGAAQKIMPRFRISIGTPCLLSAWDSWGLVAFNFPLGFGVEVEEGV